MNDLAKSGFGARPPQGARSAEIYFRLVDAIVAHRVDPGTKLSEEEIGAAFGVSRTIVRNALHALAHDGMVTLERNRGAFVAKPSLDEGRQIFHARRVLEPEIAALAALRCTGEAGQRLETHLVLETDAVAAGDHRQAIWLSGKFHLLIADIAEQFVLRQILADLIGRASLIVALYWHDSRATCHASDHASLVDAIRNHDDVRARQEMAEHMVHVERTLADRPIPDAPISVFDILSDTH